MLVGEIQKRIQTYAPTKLRHLELITLEELQEIRRIWVIEKHEIEDSVPRIYESVFGRKYPGRAIDDNLVFGASEMRILRGLCEGDQMIYELHLLKYSYV